MILMVKSRIPHVLFPSSACFPALSTPHPRPRRISGGSPRRASHRRRGQGEDRRAADRNQSKMGKNRGDELWFTMVNTMVYNVYQYFLMIYIYIQYIYICIHIQYIYNIINIRSELVYKVKSRVSGRSRI